MCYHPIYEFKRFGDRKEVVFGWLFNGVNWIQKITSIQMVDLREQDSFESELISKTIDEMIESIHEEVSYVETNRSSVELLLTNNRTIKLFLASDKFVIDFGENIIDVSIILKEIVNQHFTKYFKNKLARIEGLYTSRSQFFAIIDKLIPDKSFHKGILTNALFRDTAPITMLGEFGLKRRTRNYIFLILKSFGFESLESLLIKLDKNIQKLSFDDKRNSFAIFLKGSESGADITPNNLSFGTQKVLEILAKSIPLFINGGVMLVDEIENGLHMSLIKLIVDFYSDPEINKKSAQLFLTTHNPLIVERKIVLIHNVYLHNGKSFEAVSKLESGVVNRTEDQLKVLRQKNYYNDIFWEIRDLESKSTLSQFAINSIINNLSNSGIWQKKSA